MLNSDPITHSQPEAVATTTDKSEYQLSPAADTPLEQLKRFGEAITTTAVLAVGTFIVLRAFTATTLAQENGNGENGEEESKLSMTEAEGLQANINRKVNEGKLTEEEAERERKKVRKRYIK